MNPLETYLSELRDIHFSGAAVQETSFYGPLASLLNAVGAALRPRVHCVIQLQNRGAGLPDGGLFTAEQCRSDSGEPIAGQMPARGAIEVKSAGEEVERITESAQVLRYLERYGLVLVTNYRDFALVGRDADGNPGVLERYRLAESASAFWTLTHSPRAAETEQGERFVEFLRRVMLYAAPLAKPEDLAWLLAAYAREVKRRIEEAEFPATDTLRAALEEALGLQFEGEKGERFFRSTLVQTLFYGIFSAWSLWSKRRSPRAVGRFDWRISHWELQVPALQAIFEQILLPSRLRPLELDQVLERAGDALNRVDRTAFFDLLEKGSAIQYFYEPFLQAYDPQLRKDLGVWYTPPEIVRYMVARVDRVLREEMEIEDGLADPRVYILDPCCGTGAFLVETLACIGETLRRKGGDALLAGDLKRAAQERVFGFEILPAPFIIAHLQIGLLLQRLGVPLSYRAHERAGVYLTNALTGWDPPRGPKQHLLFPELEEERDAANHVKRDTPILVILGNPPYNAFAGTSPAEEQGLVEPYKEGLIASWGIRKFNLDDLYVRFFRVAERRIAERTGKGIVCFISNHSWISDPSFVVLRKHLLTSFDRFWVENMHGNRKISEYAPDGRTSETVFAIPGFSPGIQQGTAISLWVKHGREQDGPQVLFRDDLNDARAVERRAHLLDSLRAADFDAQYLPAIPSPANRFSFRPSTIAADYQAWPRVTELCAVAPSNGLMEKRGGALMDIERARLETRMRAYFDESLAWEAYCALRYGLTEKQARFDPQAARAKALAAESFDPARVVRYALRPFETRWCYYTGVRPVWNEPRPSLWAQCWPGNRFLLTRFNASKDPEGPPFYSTPHLSDDHFLSPDAVAIPLRLMNGLRLEKQELATLFSALGESPEPDTPVANLSKPARAYLTALGIADPDADEETAGLLWMHVLAIGYSPAYRTENADGIRQDWPRIPLPADREQLLASAALGRQVAMLLDTDAPVNFAAHPSAALLLRIAVISRAGGGSLNADAGELALTAGWGHAGKGGVTMPARGRVIARAAETPEGAEEEARRLGESTFDVFMNDLAYWRSIPAHVWDYTVGGYQVIKKWLSYREYTLLGRALTANEAREVTDIARRIAALLLLEPALDLNYRATQSACYRL